MNDQQQLPGWLTVQAPASAPATVADQDQIMSLGRYVCIHYGPRVAPVLTSTGVLALARWWHDQGAAHSIGDMALMVVLSTASAVLGTVSATSEHGEPGGMLIGFGGAGALAITAVAAYSNGMALPLIMWATATAAAYSACAHFWRQDRRQGRAYHHELSVEQLQATTTVQTTVVQALAAVEVAKVTAMGEGARLRALEEAWAARRALDAAAFPTDASGFRRLALTPKDQ